MELLGLKEVQELCGVGERKAKQLMMGAGIKRKKGQKWLISRTKLEKYIEGV